MHKFVIACAALAYTLPSWAARPFVTDDARLTTAGSCQLESWSRLYPNSTELWALPACNPAGNFEITMGAGWADTDQITHDYVLQAKTLLKPLESNGWGIGLGVGKIYHPEITPGPNQLGNTYAYVPLSVSFNDDQVVMHANLGWLRDKASKQDNMTWGVGGELKLSPRLTAIMESFGDHRSSPYGQLGLRLSVIPDLFQVDTTLGRQFNGNSDNQWISFGVRLTPATLF